LAITEKSFVKSVAETDGTAALPEPVLLALGAAEPPPAAAAAGSQDERGTAGDCRQADPLGN
jgi:hypothetical protein